MSLQNPTENHRFGSITSQFYESIYDCYQNYNFRNAIFLAERLKYLNDNENNSCLLAECYLADNSPFKSYSVLKPYKGKRAKYLFAVSCFKINKLQEAEEALYSGEAQTIKPGAKFNPDIVINGAQGLYLLAQVSEKLQKRQQAAECYLRAFQKNPTLLLALEKYIQIGGSHESVDQLTGYFKTANVNGFFGNTEIHQNVFKSYLNACGLDKENIGYEAERLNKRLSGADITGSNSNVVSKNSSAKFVFRNLKIGNNEEQGSSLTSSIKKVSPSKHKKKNQAELISNIQKPIFNQGITGASNHIHQQLFSSSINNPQSQSLGLMQSGLQNPLISNQNSSSKHTVQPSQLLVESTSSQENSITLLDYLGHLATPYIKFLVQDPLEALSSFKQLKRPLDQDPWVLINLARCCTELSLHADAEKYFKEAFLKEPHRTDSVDFYSSCLWHLKKQAELSQLAYNCLEKHYFASETWIAMANCFSLNQDHETAITYLNRAIQLDPLNSYAHCLLGHEYVSKENFEKAREFYQKAINLDPRNVRAFFGLGNLCLKTDKIDMAIDYFLNAIAINDRCSTFYTQLGIAFMSKKDYLQAMNYIRKGEALCDSDKCNKYNKCQVLYKLGNYEEALQECENLLREVKEASIYTLLGQIQQKLNLIEQAHNSYMIASNMDRKESSKIKKLIESLHKSDM